MNSLQSHLLHPPFPKPPQIKVLIQFILQLFHQLFRVKNGICIFWSGELDMDRTGCAAAPKVSEGGQGKGGRTALRGTYLGRVRERGDESRVEFWSNFWDGS